MSMAPETAVSPLQQAPPNRPTVNLEQWARQGEALLLGDRVIDENEMQILRGFFEQVAMYIQAQGGIGKGSVQPGQEEQAPGQSYQEMNENTEDFGTAEGAEPMDEGY